MGDPRGRTILSFLVWGGFFGVLSACGLSAVVSDPRSVSSWVCTGMTSSVFLLLTTLVVSKETLEVDPSRREVRQVVSRLGFRKVRQLPFDAVRTVRVALKSETVLAGKRVLPTGRWLSSPFASRTVTTEHVMLELAEPGATLVLTEQEPADARTDAQQVAAAIGAPYVER